MKFNNLKITVYSLILLSGVIFTACSEGNKTEAPAETNSSTSASKDETTSSFTITGTITDGAEKTLYLFEYGGKTPLKLDSIVCNKKGNFNLSGKTNRYKFYSIGGSINNVVALLLHGGESVTVNANFNQMAFTAKTEGSSDTKAMHEFSEKQKAFFDTMQSLKKEIEALEYDEADKRGAIIKSAEEAKLDFNQFKYSFIDHNSESPAIYLAASEIYDVVGELEYLKKIEKVMFEKMNGSPFHIAVTQKVGQANQTIANADRQKQMIEQQNQAFAKLGIEVGKTAPELNFPNPSGKNISLNSLKGKVVLLDFWASWCRPCRAENPNVVRLYNQYKNKGFTVYSYSLDNNAAKWENAIKDDRLSWPNHASDLKGWQSAGSAVYNVQSIPQTFLIGRDGKIIAIGLRGFELEEKLKELFN